MSQIVHATALEYRGLGILLIGESGAGKSDLALRMIGQGATLIADDQVAIDAQADRVFLSAPKQLQGLLEVRGIGIVKLSYTSACRLSVVIRLKSYKEIDRLPVQQYYTIGAQHILLYHIDPDRPAAVDRLKCIVDLQLGQYQLLEQDRLL